MLDDSGRGPLKGTLYTLKKYSKYPKRTSNRYFKYLIAKRYLGEGLRRNSTRRENVLLIDKTPDLLLLENTKMKIKIY